MRLSCVPTPALRALALGFAVASALGLPGCATRIETSGNEVQAAQLSNIETGPYTRDQVTAALGSPSSVSAFDHNTWYYIFERTEATAFLEPDLRERLIVTIQFDDAGRVVNVKTTGAESANQVEPSENKTPTAGNKLNFVEQMIANLGRFNQGAGTKVPKRPPAR